MKSQASLRESFEPLYKTLDIVFEAESVEKLCQSLVFTNWGTSLCFGAFVYTFNQKAELVFSDGFGRHGTEIENCVQTLEDRVMFFSTSDAGYFKASHGEQEFIFVPLISKRLTIGMICFSLRLVDETIECFEDFFRVVSRCAGFYVHTISNRRSPRNARPAPHDVSELITLRQKKILKLIEAGLTNKEIAQQVHVSESLVRHETIRIYGLLNVEGRHQAVAAAKEIGLFLTAE